MARVLPYAPAAAAQPPAPEGQTERIPLGSVLVQSGALEPAALVAALEKQKMLDQRLGRILLADGQITQDSLGDALSKQSGFGRVDLLTSPVDANLLSGLDPYRCLEIEAVPWRQIGGTRVIVISNPDNAALAREVCGGGLPKVAIALAPADDIRTALTTGFKGRLRDDARDRCPEQFSCRDWLRKPRRFWRVAAPGAMLALVLAPKLVVWFTIVWVLLFNLLTMGLRLVALFARYSVRKPAPRLETPRFADYKKLPCVSILVPLLREEKVAQKLMEGLAALDYPPALLDIKLVLEEQDDVTRAAIDAMGPVVTMEVITVPRDTLKTKPRAMNFALPFCRGEIVGVYDAEDRPDPSQIRAIVEHLQDAPPDVACVQGYLDFYNTDRNWISRCFTLEYAVWFRVVLKGVQRLGIPIPLGGTTVFFRRRILERIGGWDSHNVTEDADLGIRLARFGFRCEMIGSTTYEEANFLPLPWIRQRSRWLKGYGITWATHMREPVLLYRDLGFRGFVGFQVLFLGTLTSYLTLPLLWLAWIGGFGWGLERLSDLSVDLIGCLLTSMALGQVVMVSIMAVAARDSGRPLLFCWIPMMVFYWPLGSVAAYRAIAEIFYAPFYWHKTEHGVVAPRRPGIFTVPPRVSAWFRRRG